LTRAGTSNAKSRWLPSCFWFDLSPDDPKATVLWSGDEAETQRLQEEHPHHYLRWTFFGAVAAMIVGLIGVALSFVN
jgi:hypothetical protein